MERNEPSLVPEWLRNNGGGASDGPLLASPKSRNTKSFGYSNGSHLSFVERGSCNSSRKSLVSNGYGKQDKNSYGRSCSGSTRNYRDRDRERLDTDDDWDSEYSDSLRNIISGRIHKDTLRRSQSMISRRPSELPHRTAFTDLKYNSHNISNGENGSFERDIPDERPTTPDMSKVSSHRIGQGLTIGNPSSMHSEGWTSALIEAPSKSQSSRVSSPDFASITSVGGVSNGHKKSGSSPVAPTRPQNASLQYVQSRRVEELPSVGTKRLIPMTPTVPKTLVSNPSDKLKPKTAMKPNEVAGPKNGLHQFSSLPLGSQPVHGGSSRTDVTKSSSTGKMLLLKPARENGHSASQTAGAVPSVLGNSGSSCAASVASASSKKCSQSQVQSRNDFFNLVRKKSIMSNTSVPCDSVAQKEMASGGSSTSDESGEVKCESGVCESAERSSNNMANDLCEDDVVIHPNEEEEAFLRSLGWEDSTADEGGLTEEEINAFVHKLKIMTESDQMKWKSASKLCQGLQLSTTQSET